MKRLRESGWMQFLGIHAICIGAPLLIIVGAGPASTGLRSALQLTVASAFVLTSVLILAEALMSGRRRRGPALHGSSGPLRSLTVILVAYMPNEQDVIVDSVLSLLDDLDHPADRLQVLVAYNTPVDLPVEDELRAIAATRPSLDLLRVNGSTSKAQNLEAAIDQARGQVTAILDSDHRLEPDAASRALRWFDEGYDIVQGRCVIRESDTSLLARIVAIEFEQIYGLAHAGRSLLMDTAIFGGSNGWWRTDVIREIRFHRWMLTEDIDASTRAMLAGYRLVHDRTVISSELPPPNWRGWWKQRTRWAQGWLQVTMRHQRSIWRSNRMSWPLKGYWTVLLAWRELFPLLALQIVTLIASDYALTGSMKIQFDPLVAFSVVVTFGSGIVAGIVTWRLSLDATRRTQKWWRYAAFGLLSPVYTMVKNTVALVALGREMIGDERWVITARTAATAAATVLVGATVLTTAVAPSARAQDVPSLPSVPEAPSATDAAPTTPPVAEEQPVSSGVRTVALVPNKAQPVTLTAASPSTSWTITFPGWWTAVRGRVTLRLAGNAHLASGSRIALTVAGRQLTAGVAKPGEHTVTVDLPATSLAGSHQVTVGVATTLTTTLSRCAAPDDPTATLQVLPGSSLQVEGAVAQKLTIADLPAALVSTLGDGPSSVSLRFRRPPTPAAISAAGIAAGAIAESRGYPGVRVHVARPHERATLLIDDRPGQPRLRISTRSGVPTLTIGGDGPELIQAALAIGTPALRNTRTSSVTPRPVRTPDRLVLPNTIALQGAIDEGPGTAAATVYFQLPGRYEVARGARLQLEANVEAAGETRTTLAINDRRISARLDAGSGAPVKVDTFLAGAGPSYVRGDLQTGTNRIELSAAAVGSTSRCGRLGTVRTQIQPSGTLLVRVRDRTPEDASLATWPYPLDAKPEARTSQVILPTAPTVGEIAMVVSVLAEARRLDGEAPQATVVIGGTPNPAVPALVLARPGAVPSALARRVRGGTPSGTLAVVDTGRGAAQVLAVGTGALRPLTAGVAPQSLSALVSDVAGGVPTTRVADVRVAASETAPLPGHVKWPLLILGFSLAGIAVLALRASHRNRSRQADQ